MRFTTTVSAASSLLLLSNGAAAAAAAAAADASATAAAASAALSDRLSSLWGNAKQYIPSAGGAAARRHAINLTANNWETELGADTSVLPLSAEATTPWLVVVSGGNQTCQGRCKQLDAAFDLAALAARSDSRAPAFGYLNCEYNRLLCAIWGVGPGTAWYIEPATRSINTKPTDAEKLAEGVKKATADSKLQAKAESLVDVHRNIWQVELNKTTVGADELARLWRKAEYRTRGELVDADSSVLSRHPFDSRIARLGLSRYVGYVYFFLGMTPSWTYIMVLGMTMRTFMQRQTTGGGRETREQRAAREHREKYQPDGKVRGAPPGDARSSALL